MGKLDALKRSAGGNVAESASRRDVSPVDRAPLAALNPARMEGVARSKSALEIPLEKIEPDPGQPREEFDPEALGRLADSLRARGLLQPVRVRWSEEAGRYILIAGERRWRAAAMAGLPTLTCIVDDGQLTPAELLAVQVTENLLREDLSAVERARAYRTLMDLNGWSGNQLAKELGIAQSGVVQTLALLELPAAVQDHVEAGDLAPSIAYEVSKLGNADAQAEVAARVVAEGLSRAETIEAIRATRPRSGGSKGRGGNKVTARTLRASTGHKITIEHRRGVDDAGIIAAFREIADQLEAKHRDTGEAA